MKHSMIERYIHTINYKNVYKTILSILLVIILTRAAESQESSKKPPPPANDFNDSHFHLTNYIQEGADIHKYLEIMGNRVGRSTLFGIPLQQMWSYQNSGTYGPTYYLQSDAPLYYYSFTDAYIASVYNSLSPTEKQRFDPMITGFNPADMYAKAHIKRVLLTFPGVFSGIGEFSIHKEFVSAKVAGEAASLTNPALDSILDFAGEVGLAVILHNDMDMPFAKAGAEPVYLAQMKDLLKRHPKTTIIWAHVGLGRVVHPVQQSGSEPINNRNPRQLQIVEDILTDPALKHVYFDISWDEVAKYVIASQQSLQNTITIINRFPDRFLFGTDVVAPTSPEMYYAVFNMYEPLWKGLTPEASEKVRKRNYERIFNEARQRVREWEKAHLK
ncbi:amidohydrolase [Chitinophagaceae bacterium LB-8]|uniref:Amidohydrolase n=1 Tax=Paraflavisolibacter caeni TaxID=2982496 RepID=A0A9X3B7L3_9BACT|nr:amidohydrolase family protein [Paraflavisolibacter caeni]MCU7549395.1 amidohydrolase [Paraflavisolibacter caeni]